MGGSTIGFVGWGGAQVIIPGMTYKYQNLGLFNGIGLSQLSATGISLSCLSLSTISSSIQFIKENPGEACPADWGDQASDLTLFSKSLKIKDLF